VSWRGSRWISTPRACWEKGYVHGNVVGDDGLLLELEFLEDIGLENLFNLCEPEGQSRARIGTEDFVEGAWICHSRKFQKL
jgi:hypothetical protein